MSNPSTPSANRFRYRRLKRSELIALMQEWAKKHGETPSQSQWDSDPTVPSSNPVRVTFGSWAKGLRAAGLKVKKPTISALCRQRLIAAHKGKRSFAWKGGRHTDANGYVMVWNPSHPNAKGGRDRNYVAEHRMVMSDYLGRPLLKTEQVHHKNGDRSDNRLENLELWTTSQPSGQRVIDKLSWAKRFIALYDQTAALPAA